MSTLRLRCALLVALMLAGSAPHLFGASIVIVNKDAPGVGFNDPTAAAPVGGNSGTTLGQQRLNVFTAAAGIWGAKLQSPITIKIAASFGPLTPCFPNSGVIGSAGPTTFLRNFTGAPRANTWYPVALASALSESDLAAGQPDGASIQAEFNSNIGTAGCLTNTSWYLGLDNNHGSQIDLMTTLLHEFGHGLGFVGLVSLSDGSFAQGFPDPFAFFTYDNTVFLRWTDMNNAQRLTSMVNTGNVVFDGSAVTAGAATILSAGKDLANHPKLFVPNPKQQGSSIYHYDISAFPNQLMEPSINADLTHSVDAPEDLTAKAMYDMGWPAPAAAPEPPTNVVATATTSTNVAISWTAVAGAINYKVLRSSNGSTYGQVGSTSGLSFDDSTAVANTAYLYKVRANNGSSDSGDSNVDLATTVIFTDPSLAVGTTQVAAVHITELRTAVNAVRALTLLGAGSYTDSTLTPGSMTIKRLHITDLRTALDAARSALSLPAVSYTDTTITAGSTLIKAAHVTELRNAVK